MTKNPNSLLDPRAAHILFFGLAALFAVFTIGVTIGQYTGIINWIDQPIGYWHGREMIFGFAMAIMAGFFSGKIPKGGLIPLIIAWVLGRLGFLLWPHDALLLIPFYMAFPSLLFLFVGYPILRTSKTLRKAQFGLALFALSLVSLIVALEASGVWAFEIRGGSFLGLGLIVLMLFAMGGRITAAATNAEDQKSHGTRIKNPAQRTLEGFGVITILLTIVTNITGFAEEVSGLFGVAFAIIIILRLFGWRSWRQRDLSLLFLYLGFVWLLVGSLLWAALPWLPWFTQMDIIHCFTIGALGTFSLNIMTRICQQRLRLTMRVAGLSLMAIILVNISALARVTSPFWEDSMMALNLAAITWVAAYLIFLVFVWKMAQQQFARNTPSDLIRS
jgi:uncharacterized protein involved in response to NO